jgi:flagellar assembly factor FliW
MEISTSRFGALSISIAETICFPSGLIGFENCRSWVLLRQRPGDSVIWLQSTQEVEVALPVVDPRTFVPDFTLQLEQCDWNPLGKREEDAIQVLVAVVGNGTSLYLNLLAPLAINCDRRLGRQVINLDPWSVDHCIGEAGQDFKKIA